MCVLTTGVVGSLCPQCVHAILVIAGSSSSSDVSGWGSRDAVGGSFSRMCFREEGKGQAPRKPPLQCAGVKDTSQSSAIKEGFFTHFLSSG